MTNRSNPSEARVSTDTAVIGGSTRMVPLREFIDSSWDSIVEEVRSGCRARLRGNILLDSEDCAQDVFVILLRRDFGRKFDPRLADFWSYLAGVVDHACSKAGARSGRAPEPAKWRGPVEASTGNPADEAEQSELRDAVDDARRFLSPAEAAAFDQVMARAEGSRDAYVSDERPKYWAACRCRSRLRRILKIHASG